MGNNTWLDFLGVLAGHTYYYLEDVFPVQAAAGRWRVHRPLRTPWAFHYACGSLPPDRTGALTGAGGRRRHTQLTHLARVVLRVAGPRRVWRR